MAVPEAAREPVRLAMQVPWRARSGGFADDALRLARLVEPIDTHYKVTRRMDSPRVMLNVIPYNPVAGLPYQTPSASAVNRFRDILIDGGINVKFRQRKGAEIDAACGQLRRSTPLLALGASPP